MRCLCSLIMIKSGGRRMADIAMALSPPQVEPWRLKQGTEAMDSWRGNFIDRIYYLLTILSFICRAFCDGIVLVHLEKGQQAVRDVQQSEETEACHHFQAILEQTMVSWWLITTDYTIIRNCIFWLHSVSCLILFFLFRAGYRRVWCSLMQSESSSEGFAVDLPGRRYQWVGFYPICSSFPHYAACGRRRMSPSARHKQRFVLPG